MKELINAILVFSTVLMAGLGSYAQPDRTPYVSAAPKFTFGETLAEQEEELRSNPLIQRFAESRKRQASDKFRPIYHFVSPESMLNDPNGLSYWQGKCFAKGE